MADFRLFAGEDEDDEHYDVADFVLDGKQHPKKICRLTQPHACSVTIGTDVERDDQKVTVVIAFRSDKNNDPFRYEKVFDSGNDAMDYAEALANVLEHVEVTLNSRNFAKLLLTLGLTFSSY